MMLNAKTAIVTGAAMGIGKAIAIDLAREGADVVVTDLNLEEAKKVADEIKAIGRKALAIKTDVTKSAEVNQMVKNVLLSREKTLSRKLQEVLLAREIERQWAKQEILERYLNQVFYGSGAYGVKAAARIYFGRPLSKLTLAECALLAGLSGGAARALTAAKGRVVLTVKGRISRHNNAQVADFDMDMLADLPQHRFVTGKVGGIQGIVNEERQRDIQADLAASCKCGRIGPLAFAFHQSKRTHTGTFRQQA